MVIASVGVFQESTIMTRHWEPVVLYNVWELLNTKGQSYKDIQGHSSQVLSCLLIVRATLARWITQPICQ